MQRKVVGEEIAGILDSKMPREIADVVLGYVVSGRVAKAYKAVVGDIFDGGEIYWWIDIFGRPQRNFCTMRIINYRCGIQKVIASCKKCYAIQFVEFEGKRRQYHECYSDMCVEGFQKIANPIRVTASPERIRLWDGLKEVEFFAAKNEEGICRSCGHSGRAGAEGDHRYYFTEDDSGD
nr:hypothetical protein K-LCC10_0498 [Kaumoebavirus]